jgi:CBS domain containing-hemolysin-like protein
MSTRYSNHDLKALIELHSYHALEAIGEMNETNNDAGLNQYQMKMINSVIDFRAGTVKKLMIPPQQIFSLNVNKKIDNHIAKKVTKAGFSRIPVYEKNDKNRIIGIMLIKTLIGVELGTGKKVSDLVNEGEVTLRKPIFISQNEKFETLLNKFLKGKSHMAIVTDDPQKMEEYLAGFEDNAGDISLYEQDGLDSENGNIKRTENEPAQILGLLTLEDLIEFIIKEDILDEADYDNDLEKNKNPNTRANRNFGSSQNNMSKFIIENRDKVNKIVQNQLSTNPDKRSVFKFQSNATKSIVQDERRGSLMTPLLDKSKQEGE